MVTLLNWFDFSKMNYEEKDVLKNGVLGMSYSIVYQQ